jgi:hypothetical protein
LLSGSLHITITSFTTTITTSTPDHHITTITTITTLSPATDSVMTTIIIVGMTALVAAMVNGY